MDALLPPLEACVAELVAPPDFNENSNSNPSPENADATHTTDASEDNTEGHCLKTPCSDAPSVSLDTNGSGVYEAPAPLESEGADEDAVVDNGLEPLESQSEDLYEDARDDPVPVAQEMENNEDPEKSFEDQQDDEITHTVSKLMDDIVGEISGKLDGMEMEASSDSDAEDTEQPVLRKCFIKLDKREITRYRVNLRRRQQREAERLREKEALELAEKREKRVRDTAPRQATSSALPSLPNMSRVVCKECGESYLDMRTFRFHFRAKHPDNLDDIISVCGRVKQFIICPVCEVTFRTKVDFNSHMANLHSLNKGLFEGLDCYDEELIREFVSETMKKRSEKPTTATKTFKEPEHFPQSGQPHCDICKRKFTTWKGANCHKTMNHTPGRPPPNSHKFPATLPVPSPVPPAERSKPVSKPASKTTSYVKPITQPKATPKPASKVSPKVTPGPASSKPLVCEWCRDRLKTMAQLKTHLRSKHSVPDNFSPEGCNLADFFTALEHHFTVQEMEENSYECVNCKETFLEKVGLLEHFSGEHLKSKVVGMQIRLQCSICGHDDSDVRNLHDHMWNEHANQRLEDLVIRVSDVCTSHRCGEECKLLWKKPVVAVEAAPRPAVKRPSSEVAAMPHSVKMRRLGNPNDQPSNGDSDEEMRMIEAIEEKQLSAEQAQEQKKIKDRAKYKNKKAAKAEKKRIANERYKEKLKLKKMGLEPSTSLTQVGTSSAVDQETVYLTPQVTIKMTEESPKKKQSTNRCPLCCNFVADLQKHLEEAHPTNDGKSKRHSSLRNSMESPVATEVPSEPLVQAPESSTPPSKMPGPKSKTINRSFVSRCPLCKLHFPDIISLMKHRMHCSAAPKPPPPALLPIQAPKLPSPPKVPSAPKAKPVAISQGSTAQFVLMDEDSGPATSNIKCDICKTHYTSVAEYQAHIQEFHMNALCCDLCDKSFAEEQSLQKHYRRGHDMTYDCPSCNTKFTNKKLFLKHMWDTYRVPKSLFPNISINEPEKIRAIWDSLPSMQNFRKIRAKNGASSSSQVKSSGPMIPKIKMEAPDLPVMYQCELCDVCYASPEEIKEHMQYVH